MKVASVVLATMLAAGAHAQTTPAVVQEGAYWVETASGSAALAGARRLRVQTLGSLKVRGDAGQQVSYALTKRVRARDQAEAARLMESVKINTRSAGDWLHLTVTCPDGNAIATELAVTAPRSLAQAAVEARWGNVEVRGLDGAVEAESGGGRIEAGEIGGGVNAKTAGGEVRLGKVGGPVHCLSGGGAIRVGSVGGEAWFETAGGEISVEDAAGPVHASTAGGNIHIDRAASTVSVRTAGGLIDVGHAGGAVTAETAGGSIQIGTARGVRCESAAGAIRLRGASGALRAATGVGNILAELLAGRTLADSYLNTGAGDITVYIPSNLAVTVQAHSVSAGRIAKIISDFPEIRIHAADLPKRQPAFAEGTLNGGGPVLKISAAGGNIYLRRRQ